MDINLLKKTYDDNSLQEILSLFERETTSLLTQMQEALIKQDNELLAKLAHQLKGATLVLYAHKMTELSLKLEEAADNLNWDSAAIALNQLHLAFALACREINTYTNLLKEDK